MKIIKTTFETKVEEKDKTIVNLQKFVDKAQMKIKDLMDEKGGEDSEIIFNFSNSVQPLIEQVRELQSVKVALTEKHLKCQHNLSKQQQELEALKKSLQEEYVLKDDYLLLQKEKNLFQKMSESNKVNNVCFVFLRRFKNQITGWDFLCDLTKFTQYTTAKTILHSI